MRLQKSCRWAAASREIQNRTSGRMLAATLQKFVACTSENRRCSASEEMLDASLAVWQQHDASEQLCQNVMHLKSCARM
jgi:hypothetical protein